MSSRFPRTSQRDGPLSPLSPASSALLRTLGEIERPRGTSRFGDQA